MGVVRVAVRLTNAVDEALARRGTLPHADVRTYEADALVDTGAVRMVLPPQVVSRLGLGVRGQRVAEYADGRTEAVDVTEPLVVEINGRDTLEEALVLGDEVLIGQTVLEKLDLFVDSRRRLLIPNPAHPDQPITKVKYAASRTAKRTPDESVRSTSPSPTVWMSKPEGVRTPNSLR
jgi:clan AA aspartic protease